MWAAAGNNQRPLISRPGPLFRPLSAINYADQQSVPRRQPIFLTYNNIQMVTCQQENVINAQQNLHCSSVQSTSSLQEVSAMQVNVTNGLQSVTAEQQGGSMVQQQVSATKNTQQNLCCSSSSQVVSARAGERD